MADENFSNLSEEQLSRLVHEAALVEILRLRNPPSKPWWQKLAESSAIVALITVVLGGFVGAYLTSRFQWQSKEKELSLLNSQKFIEKRDEEIKNIFDSLGSTVVAADEAIKFISFPGNNAEKLRKSGYIKEAEAIEKDRDSVGEKFNEAKRKWYAEKEKFALLLSYFYNNNEEIKNSWDKVDQSIEAYLAQQKKCWEFPNTECAKSAEQKDALYTNISVLKATFIKESLKPANINSRANQSPIP